MYYRLLFGISFVWTLVSCATLEEDKGPPALTEKTSIQMIFDTAIQYGGDTLKKAKMLTAKTGRWSQLSSISYQYLLKKVPTRDAQQVHRAASLYLVSTPRVDLRIVKTLSRSRRPDLELIAWQMCSVRPSESTRSFLEEEASYFISSNQEARIMTPEFAYAVSSNQVKSLFSVMVRGLSTQGSDVFARAMISLNSGDLSQPFMDYLSRADLDDLRQINQKTIDPYTSLVILRYFLSHPLPIGHQQLGHIFLYAVSRNIALSDMAREVIEYQLPLHKEVLVQSLARQPLKVQVAYVETIRQNPTSHHRQILFELKKMTRYSEVIEEINSIKTY